MLVPMQDETSTAARFDPGRRRAVLIALVMVTALAAFEGTVVSTAMPTIIAEVRGLPLYAWVFSVYLLGSTITMPLYGRLADIHGRRRTLLVAIALFLVGAGSCALARTMPQLIVARGIQGLGAGGVLPVAMTVSGDLYNLKERARVQALFSGVWGIASLTGPLIGAWLTLTFGWRSIFSINLPLGAIAFGLVLTKMIESRPARDESIDHWGALLLAVAVGSALGATLHQPGGGALAVSAPLGLLAIAVGSAIAFWRRQGRLEHPLVPPALFSRKETLAPYVAGVVFGTIIYGADAYVPLFVQGARGGTAMAAGAAVTPLMLAWAISATLAARGIVRFGFRHAAIAGAALIAIGLILLIVAVLRHAPMVAISTACFVVGFGLGPSSMAQVLAIQHLAPERERGVATALVPFSRTVGGSLGVGVLGGVLAAGLTSRLGPQAVAAADALARSGTNAPESAAFRSALAGSLMPVFLLLLGLGVINLWLTAHFPGLARGEAESEAREVVAEAH
jgi:MFS family permease